MCSPLPHRGAELAGLLLAFGDIVPGHGLPAGWVQQAGGLAEGCLGLAEGCLVCSPLPASTRSLGSPCENAWGLEKSETVFVSNTWLGFF